MLSRLLGNMAILCICVDPVSPVCRFCGRFLLRVDLNIEPVVTNRPAPTIALYAGAHVDCWTVDEHVNVNVVYSFIFKFIVLYCGLFECFYNQLFDLRCKFRLFTERSSFD